MKLRTRLKISFCILIIMPITMCMITFLLISHYQSRNINELYGIEDASSSVVANMYTPVSILNKMTNSVYQDMVKTANNNPQLYEDKEYITNLSEALSERMSTLVIRCNGNIAYSNSKFTSRQLYKLLPEYDDAANDLDCGTYHGGEYQCLIKQIDFIGSNGDAYSVSIITSLQSLLPQIKMIVVEGIIAMVLILFMTSAILTIWIYRAMVRPLDRLKLATKNIKDGNLDIEMKVEGNDEIAEVCQDFEEMRVILQRSADERMKADVEEKELIRNISHDLKTPLTAIKGYVEGLIDGVADSPEKQEKYLKTIYNKVNDMDKLINELTIYSRIDTNRIPYVFKKINVKDYMEDCCEEIRMDLEAKGFELVYNNSCQDDMCVTADAEQIKRVINNIVSNSVKYMADRKGIISIDVSDSNDYVNISIEDNGKGISQEDLPNIFDRFYRADSSRNSKQGGSGIGLAIVKKIIEEHGGSIYAESVEGEGTTIHFSLKKYSKRCVTDNVENQDGMYAVKDKKTDKKLEKKLDKKADKKTAKNKN